MQRLDGITRLTAALALAIGLALAPSCNEPEHACTPDGARSLYERRIEPVLLDDRPKSCNQCHLSGVDLAAFVKPTPCQTMACMADRGLVDLANPQESLVLSWIARAEPESEGITASVIDEEYQGFLEWIEHSAACGERACPTFDDPCGLAEGEEAPECELIDIDDDWEPFDDPGGCSDLVIEAMFANDVYAFRGRCHPCHWSTFPDTIAEAPKWLQIGDCDVASLETLRQIEERGYIDIAEPLKSPLLLKPLAEEIGGVEHGGGPKYHDDSEEGLMALKRFLQRYAECRK